LTYTTSYFLMIQLDIHKSNTHLTLLEEPPAHRRPCFLDNTTIAMKERREIRSSLIFYNVGLHGLENKWSAVPWALRLQRVVLQGSFASWALLYFRVKLSTLGPLLQGSGAVVEGLFSGRALRLRVSLFN
jgi:hypothetical protein